MTLPTIQPIDWPDWGVMPTTSATAFNVTAVASPGDIVAEFAVGYFSYAILMLTSDGDGSDWQLNLEWYTASQSEGGSLVGLVTTTRMFGTNVIVPTSVWAPYLLLRDVDASAYPHNVLGTLTLASQPPRGVGFPGGTYVINQTQNIAGPGNAYYVPLGCWPGEHSVQVITDATAWDLSLVEFPDPGTAPTVLLADETTPTPYDIRFIGAASTWWLLFANNDGMARNARLIVTRQL